MNLLSRCFSLAGLLSLSTAVSAQAFVVNEFYRDGTLSAGNEWIEVVLRQDLSAAQLETYLVGDSQGATTSKLGAYQFAGMAAIAADFRAGTIIVVSGAAGPAADSSYDPDNGDWNLVLHTNGSNLTTVTAGGDLAGTDVVWVDTVATGATIAPDGFCVNYDSTPGAFGGVCQVTIAAPGNVTGAVLGGDVMTAAATPASWTVSVAPASLTPGQPNGGDNTTSIDDLRGPPPVPAVSFDNPSVLEGDPPGSTTLTFTATLAQAIGDDCTFRVENFGTPPGTQATAGVDYVFPSPDPTVTILAGQTQATFDVTIIRDTDIEDDEVFAVTAYGEPFECDIISADGVGTILNDDAVALPDISINNVAVVEGDVGTTLATLTVSLSAPAPAGGVIVQYATSDAGATAALGDYVAASGSVSFAPGDQTQPLPITINGDTFFEFNETLNVTLSGAVGGTIVGNIGQVTIVNDDLAPTLQVADASIVEGTGVGTTTLVFTATLSAEPAPDQPAMVDYSTASGSALAGTDFTSASGTLSFTNGTGLTRTINVPITRDIIDEGDETFSVTLSNVFNAQIPQPTATGTIQDDDTAVVSVSNVSQNEGDAGVSAMDFTVSLSVPAATTRFYGAFTADGTAVAPGDYIALPLGPTTVVFAPGETIQTVSVQINGDTSVEPDETFTLNLVDAASIEGGNPPPAASGTGTIVNDDVLVDVSISDASVTEGTGAGSTNAIFTVTLSAQPPAGSPLTVNYATTGGSATSGTDFTATSGALTFSNGGGLTQSISVPVTRDNIDENDESFVIDITAPAATVTDGQGAGTILDDDAEPTPTIAGISLGEGDSGLSSATFSITLSNPSAFPLTYQASTADGSAVAPGDYQAIASGLNNVSFAPLQTTQTITVNVVGETLVEADETFVLNLRSAVPTDGAPPIVASATATVNNDDSATLSLVGSSGPEGNVGLTPRQFTATLSNPVQAQVQVNYATADGSATVADNDYQAASGTLTFAGSTTTQTLNVNVIGDLEVEPDQSFTVNLSGLNAPAGVSLGTTSATGTIVNDDATSFSITGASVTEGTGGNSTLNFTVSLSAPAKDPVSVQFASVNGSAIAPADYTATSGTLTFDGGQTTQTIAVTVIGENLVEPDETLQVQLSNPNGGSIGIGSATGTIVNDDFAVLSINDVSQNEGNGNGTTAFVFSVCTSNPSTSPISVDYQTGNGSANAPGDYVAASGTATIPALATCVTVTVTVIADNLVEPDETFTLNLSNAQGANIGDAVGVGTILGDDDLIPVPALDSRSLALLVALMLAIGMFGIARKR
jgi:hypothetical protein